jgi:hypothetical protein
MIYPLFLLVLYANWPKTINVKYCVVLTGMLRFEPASQCAERCHSDVGCALNIDDLISKNSVNSVSNKKVTCFNVHLNNRLTDILATLYTYEEVLASVTLTLTEDPP